MDGEFQTDTIQKAGAKPESTFMRVSVRAWLALLLTGTVCTMAMRALKVDEPLYSAFMLSLGFYFGQKK